MVERPSSLVCLQQVTKYVWVGAKFLTYNMQKLARAQTQIEEINFDQWKSQK